MAAQHKLCACRPFAGRRGYPAPTCPGRGRDGRDAPLDGTDGNSALGELALDTPTRTAMHRLCFLNIRNFRDLKNDFSIDCIVGRVSVLCNLPRLLLGPQSNPFSIDTSGLAYFQSADPAQSCTRPSQVPGAESSPPSPTCTRAPSAAVTELKGVTPFVPPGLWSLLKPTLMCCCQTQRGSTRPRLPVAPPPLSRGLPPARSSFCLAIPTHRSEGRPDAPGAVCTAEPEGGPKKQPECGGRQAWKPPSRF